MFPELDSVEQDTAFFDHFVGQARPSHAYRAWLDWLEAEAPWELTVTDFYEQHEFSLLHTVLPTFLQHLTCQQTLTTLRNRMFRHFREPVSERVDVTAHKLSEGQTIRIHNDFIPKGETHRLLLQLNRSWHPSHGGYLMFFSGPEPESLGKVIEPNNGSVQAFVISPQSYHAVSTVHGGERFTIVYSFYADGQGA